jgi:predicted AAA+ superfamily ATPase
VQTGAILGLVITRNLQPHLIELAGQYPVVTVTGPRQSGKSTLCVDAFPHLRRVSLEPLDQRDFARSDPRGFLAEYRAGAIIDEVQLVPELLSYLQEEVDRDPTPGRFVLTGSQSLSLGEGVAQSLAGRTGLAHLLPLSLDEVRRFPAPATDLWEVVFRGGYPRIHDRGIPPSRWLADYVSTYVERDVHAALAVRDLGAFSAFIRLVAARTAQELNLSELGADAGVSQPTARGWLSVLETSFLCHRLESDARNTRKRIVERPKLHLVDSGLAAWLLGIESADQLRHHPLRGAVFETWVVGEVLKSRLNRGLTPRLRHRREVRGHEIDLLVERSPDVLVAVECKSGATVAADQFKALAAFEPGERLGVTPQVLRRLVYGGDTSQRRSAAELVGWSDVASIEW